MPKDPNLFAKGIIDGIIAKHDPDAAPAPVEVKPDPKKQAAGRKGGLKGGKARAAKLSRTKRKKIAKKAATARWDEVRRHTSG